MNRNRTPIRSSHVHDLGIVRMNRTTSEPAGASAGSGWSDDAFRNARRMGEAGAKGDQPQDMVQAKQDPRRPEWAIAGRPQRLAMGGDARRIMDPLGRRRRQSGH